MRLCAKYSYYSLENFCSASGRGHMYCIQQVIQGENFRDRLKNRDESFTPRKVLPYTVYQLMLFSQHKIMAYIFYVYQLTLRTCYSS